MFPLIDTLGFSSHTDFVLAFLIGIGFGFMLEQAGFGNAKKLAMEFYLRDMTVLKVMFTAIITAMTGMVLFSAAGWLDASLVWINPTYLWAGVVGGVIMGFGFIIGGYCPGTSLVGVATAKVDAAFNVLGALLGMFVFGELIPMPWLTALFEHQTEGFSGFLTLPEWLGVKPGLVAAAVVLMALGAFWAAEAAERRFGDVASDDGTGEPESTDDVTQLQHVAA